ncbi:MAG: hypothetical protein HC822_10400 [Oscillochloris sp.]|nr:hypothetical protein [Oscillochloris sp.]
MIYRYLVGSRAYGLDDGASDMNRRGLYLPPARLLSLLAAHTHPDSGVRSTGLARPATTQCSPA